jgi:hypothetical protein
VASCFSFRRLTERLYTMSHNRALLMTARAEALFTSHLSAKRWHGPAEVAAAIEQAIRRHHGSRGCTAEVASAYGDHPETAAPRMRWARGVVDQLYAPQTRHTSAAPRCPHRPAMARFSPQPRAQVLLSAAHAA